MVHIMCYPSQNRHTVGLHAVALHHCCSRALLQAPPTPLLSGRRGCLSVRDPSSNCYFVA
eukprot:scaffold11237_cov68-Skeletonema_dohrnii-CCMP3373.AAC.2